MVDIKAFSGFEIVQGGVCAAQGFKANGVCCGLAHKPLNKTEENSAIANNAFPENTKKKNDLAAIYCEKMCSAAAVYTTNKVKGAPINVTKKNIANGYAKAVIVNSVNANCCNADGELKAEMMCKILADQLNIEKSDVIVASTGVIGQILPIEPIENAAKELCEGLTFDGNECACEAIMTTDTVKKQIAVKFKIGNKEVTLGGMLKGSGMIHPNMATTLTFLTTDCDIAPEFLQRALSDNVKITLNMASVDGDTSTNDMVCVLANGMAGNKKINSENADYETFKNALYVVMLNLARMMARDGEGATKLIECICTGANDDETARKVAKSVVCSSLFKAAIFGQDANCGRIFCAVGYSGGEFEVENLSVSMASKQGCIDVCENGSVLDFDEDIAAKILSEEEINIHVRVGAGDYSATAWGCDLTYDYVKINGDYRS